MKPTRPREQLTGLPLGEHSLPHELAGQTSAVGHLGGRLAGSRKSLGSEQATRCEQLEKLSRAGNLTRLRHPFSNSSRSTMDDCGCRQQRAIVNETPQVPFLRQLGQLASKMRNSEFATHPSRPILTGSEALRGRHPTISVRFVADSQETPKFPCQVCRLSRVICERRKCWF